MILWEFMKYVEYFRITIQITNRKRRIQLDKFIFVGGQRKYWQIIELFMKPTDFMYPQSITVNCNCIVNRTQLYVFIIKLKSFLIYNQCINYEQSAPFLSEKILLVQSTFSTIRQLAIKMQQAGNHQLFDYVIFGKLRAILIYQTQLSTFRISIPKYWVLVNRFIKVYKNERQERFQNQKN